MPNVHEEKYFVFKIALCNSCVSLDKQDFLIHLVQNYLWISWLFDVQVYTLFFRVAEGG